MIYRSKSTRVLIKEQKLSHVLYKVTFCVISKLVLCYTVNQSPTLWIISPFCQCHKLVVILQNDCLSIVTAVFSLHFNWLYHNSCNSKPCLDPGNECWQSSFTWLWYGAADRVPVGCFPSFLKNDEVLSLSVPLILIHSHFCSCLKKP